MTFTIPVTSTEPGPPSGNRIQCVVSSCAWHLDMEPPPAVSPLVLGDVFGNGVMAAVAYNNYCATIERELSRHFSTHTVVEFVSEITRLSKLVTGLKAQIPPAERAWADHDSANAEG